MNKVLSNINSIITLEFLQRQKENQYFECEGLGKRDINAIYYFKKNISNLKQ